MRNPSFFVAAVVCALAPAGAVLGEVTIEESLLSPLGQGFSYAPSPAPADLVTIGPAGSRMAVYRNGEAGPKFDEIIATRPTQEGGGGAQIMFSPDGSRYAYVGRKRGEFTLIVDGEEVAAGQFEGVNNIEGVGFTPDSQHYFYRLRQQDEAGASPSFFVMDGVRSPAFQPGQLQVIVSPVGSGYVAVGTLAGTREQVFVRDGEVVDERPSHMFYRHDGKLFTQGHEEGSRDVILKLDGEEIFRGAYMVQNFVPAPAGESWALIGNPIGGGNVTKLVVNGEVIDGQLPNMVSADRILFSDDGSRWAAIMQPRMGRQYVVVDGEAQDEYQSIHELSFSPDGSRCTYWGRSPSGAYFVIDGEEQDGVSGITPPPVYGGGGAHVGWAEVTTQNPAKYSVLYDGAAVTGDHQIQTTTIGMSPDGLRMGFLTGPMISEITPEGVRKYEGIRVVAAGINARGGGFRAMPHGFMYSPDSRFMVFYGTDAQRQVQHVYFNGTPVFAAPGAEAIRLGFSPDSKHFFIVMGAGNVRTLYVDGVPVLEYPAQPFENDPKSWHIDDAGVLHFLVADNEGIKRVDVTPSADRSVDDLVGG